MSIFIDKLTEGGWNVAVRKRTAGLLPADLETPFSLIPNTWRTWEADPFVFEHDGRIYIFAELFDYFTRKGTIGYTVLENGAWKRWKVVIDEPFHMSYPNVFRMGQDIFMVPETSADRSLRLYRAVSFPDQWEFVRVLAQDVQWVDTTFWQAAGKRFAITRDESRPDAPRDLLLELSDRLDLLSITPIREERPAYSRPGGNFIGAEGRYIRVSQDCSAHYGGGLVFSEFDPAALAGQGMAQTAQHLSPAQIPLTRRRSWTGMHTYNISEHYEVIDVERRHFHLGGFLMRLLWKLRRS